MGERQTPENDAACRIEDGVCSRHTPNNPTCVLHAPDSTPTEREAGDVGEVADRDRAWAEFRDGPNYTPTDRYPARDAFDAGWTLAHQYHRLAAAEREAGDVGEVAAVLADHWPHPVFGCDCMPTDEETGQTGFLDGAWEAHVSAALAPLIAERERAAGARALREAADRMPAFHDRDAPEWAITSACRWLRDRATVLEDPGA